MLEEIGRGEQSEPSPTVQQVWATVNPAHAIQRVTASLVFAEAIPLFIVSRIADAVREQAAGLGLRHEETLNSVLINMSAIGGSPNTSDAQAGTLFQQRQGAAILQQLVLSREQISLHSMAYTRWIGFREMLVPLVRVAAPYISQAVELKQVSLEYLDMFYAREPGRADAGLIINGESRSINTQAFNRWEPFHSHSGWFEKVGAERHLVNADVASTDANGPPGQRRVVTIRTLEAIVRDESDNGSTPIPTEPEGLASSMDALHVSLKGRIRNLLTDAAASMISLES